MLKARVIPVLLYRRGMLVKGQRFNSWRQIGSPMSAARVYERRGVDELILLDIGATPDGAPPDFELVARIADECFMPLTIGGGVRSIGDIRRLLAVGADKVSICTAAIEKPHLIWTAAEKFGRQCVTVSIDVRHRDDGVREVHSRCGTQPERRDPVAWAREAEDRGAGEILLNAIDRDGTMAGYDLELVESVAQAVNIPVVACGGAGSADDMKAALKAGASAVAASALFHFTEATPKRASQDLAAEGVAVRL